MIVIDLDKYPEGLTCQTIARRLLNAGHHELTQLAFVRGKTPIFKSFDTIGYFANHRVVESQHGADMKRVTDLYILPQEKPNGTETTHQAA